MSDATEILRQIEAGDGAAADQLLPLVYDELRGLAARKLAQERPGQTLQATALVHEAYLRLVGPGGEAETARWDSRRHFFAAAAEAMRRLLVEAARRKARLKRGGGLARRELESADLAIERVPDDLLALDEALDRLAKVDAPAARIVQLRYFAGLSIPQAARMLGVSDRTADRLWAYARAWLHEAIYGKSD